MKSFFYGFCICAISIFPANMQASLDQQEDVLHEQIIMKPLDQLEKAKSDFQSAKDQYHKNKNSYEEYLPKLYDAIHGISQLSKKKLEDKVLARKTFEFAKEVNSFMTADLSHGIADKIDIFDKELIDKSPEYVNWSEKSRRDKKSGKWIRLSDVLFLKFVKIEVRLLSQIDVTHADKVNVSDRFKWVYNYYKDESTDVDVKELKMKNFNTVLRLFLDYLKIDQSPEKSIEEMQKLLDIK